MIYFDYSRIFTNTSLHYIRMKIMKYPNDVVTSEDDEKRLMKEYPKKNQRYPEMLGDYCHRVLTTKGMVSDFEYPNILIILYDLDTYSLNDIEKMISEKGLVIEITNHKNIKGRFGFYSY